MRSPEILVEWDISLHPNLGQFLCLSHPPETLLQYLALAKDMASPGPSTALSRSVAAGHSSQIWDCPA